MPGMRRRKIATRGLQGKAVRKRKAGKRTAS
jgi:hypothetical protein